MTKLQRAILEAIVANGTLVRTGEVWKVQTEIGADVIVKNRTAQSLVRRGWVVSVPGGRFRGVTLWRHPITSRGKEALARALVFEK